MSPQYLDYSDTIRLPAVLERVLAFSTCQKAARSGARLPPSEYGKSPEKCTFGGFLRAPTVVDVSRALNDGWRNVSHCHQNTSMSAIALSPTRVPRMKKTAGTATAIKRAGIAGFNQPGFRLDVIPIDAKETQESTTPRTMSKPLLRARFANSNAGAGTHSPGEVLRPHSRG